jgi:hypothetical protein
VLGRKSHLLGIKSALQMQIAMLMEMTKARQANAAQIIHVLRVEVWNASERVYVVETYFFFVISLIVLERLSHPLFVALGQLFE